jgi:hypothetical protein
MAGYFIKKRRGSPIGGMAFAALFFVVLLALVLWGFTSISRSAQEERMAAADQAVRRAVVQCYAIEGAYPKDLAYMEERYGLILDRDSYVYHYQHLGSNLIPEISVFPIR